MKKEKSDTFAVKKKISDKKWDEVVYKHKHNCQHSCQRVKSNN